MRILLHSALARVIAATVVAASLDAGAQSPAALSALPNTVWMQSFRSPTAEYELKGAASAGDALWLVVGTRPKGQLGGAQKDELWRIDSRGGRGSTTDLSNVGGTEKPAESASAFYGITALPNGHAAMLFQAGDTIAYVVVDPSGAVVSNQAIAPAVSNAFITRVKLSNGSVLATGRQGTDGLILKLRPSGQPISNLRIRSVPLFEDAFETEDGYVALGASPGNPSGEVWIGRIGVNGSVGPHTTFAGVNPSFTFDPHGPGYVVVYQTNAEKGRHIVVQAVTAALSASWTSTLPDTVSGLRPFAVEPVGESEFLLVGEGEKSVPLVQRLKTGGQPGWRYEHREPQMLMTRAGTSALIRWNDDYAIAFTLTVVEAKGGTYEQRQIVTLARARAD